MRSQFTRAEHKPSEVRTLTESLKPTRDAFESMTTSQKIITLLQQHPVNSIAKRTGVSVHHVHNVINAYMQAPLDEPNPTNMH